MEYTFPEDWEKQQPTSQKKRKHVESTSFTDAEKNVPEESIASFELSPLVKQIMMNIHNTQSTPAIPAELDLDVILSHVSFSDILKSFFRSDFSTQQKHIPIVSKIYEESFMREPYASERPCASGTLCECNFIDPENPFTAVEFIVPGESVSETPQLCVLCSRKITQKCFYDIVFTGKEFEAPIQRYGNICSAPQEYARECVLICPVHMPLQCMPFPMMSHQRNKYEVFINNGIKMLRQIHVSFEDFRPPLTSE